MNGLWIKRSILGAIALAVIGAFIYALSPKPVLVDTTVIARGPLKVTVDEEGETRIREIYVVSSPLDGRVLRSPREVGDVVMKDKTLLAVIEPGDPSFLDIRTRRELEAVVAAAEASIILTESEIDRAESELEFAMSDMKRAKSLAERGTISERTLEKAALDVQTRQAGLAQARANLILRHRQRDSAQARLIGPEKKRDKAKNDSCCVEVHAPVDGKVLRIDKESEQIVKAGEPLLRIGDPKDLEIVVDLLSTDAVKVKTGAQARIEGWGGPKPLTAKVRRIDPAGFTKVSALGIEEQRVNTILDLTSPREELPTLGHDFRVFVRITVWSSEDALKVPLGALFRQGNRWAVFKVVDGTARLTPVKIGQRNTHMAEIIEGLEPGARVILHPSDRVISGSDVEERLDEAHSGCRNKRPAPSGSDIAKTCPQNITIGSVIPSPASAS
jgi:HlyD family secretion protein